MNKNKIEIKLFKSPIGNSKKQKRILDSLGLRKINQIITHENSPEITGMINKVKHLVKTIQV